MRDGAKQELARKLRKGMTDAERALWRCLRLQQLNVKFRRQHPIGPYVVDFMCIERGLIVEVDGGQHNASTHDERRDRWLREQGCRVVRYWNDDVLVRTGDVVEDIARALFVERPHPNLPPCTGEGAKA